MTDVTDDVVKVVERGRLLGYQDRTIASDAVYVATPHIRAAVFDELIAEASTDADGEPYEVLCSWGGTLADWLRSKKELTND